MTEESNQIWIPCPTCRGWGEITKIANIYQHKVKVPCPQCAGMKILNSATGLPPLFRTIGEEMKSKNQV